MATIILRLGKGSPLTNSELDSNFTNLNTELGTKASTASLSAVAFTGTFSSLTVKPTTLSGYGITDAQAALVSGTNIKTLNGATLLGSGDITITSGVSSFNTRTGAITLSSADVTSALGFTPYNSTNPSGYLTSTTAANTFLPLSGGTLTGQVTGGLAAGSQALDFAVSDNYASMRVIRNNSAGPGNRDGMYIGYENSNSGLTRIFGGGAGSGGIQISGSGVNDVTIAGNTALNAGNYNSYAPTLTGTGASGTWNINITGSAGPATTALRVIGGNLNPAGIAFNNALISASGSNRVVTFDGNGSTPSVWWSNGSRAYGAIDAQDPGLTFWANNGSTWWQQMAVNYGNVTINTDIRSPIYYDSNNTAYYGDFASTSNLYNLVVNNSTTFYNDGSSRAMYIRGSGNIIQFCDADGTFRWENVGRNGTYYIYKGYGTGSGYKFQANDDGTITINNGYNTTINGNLYAPIFYDSNDTGYYVDPASTSNSALRMRGGALFGPNVTWGQYLSVGTDGNASTSYASVATTNGNLHLDAKSGNATYLNYYAGSNVYFGNGASGGLYAQIASDGSFRSPIYYDYNNTGYYVDPNGTSNIYTLTVNNTATISSTVDGMFTLNKSSGTAWNYVNYSVAGTRRFYFGLNSSYEPELGVDNGATIRFLTSLDVSGNLYAPIFYDRNDTAYYCDPNGVSNFNTRLQIQTYNGYSPSYTHGLQLGGNAGITPWNFNPGGSSEYRNLTFYATGWNGSSVVTRSVLTIGNYGGFVGIRNDSPTYELDISGTGYASSSLRAPIFYDSDNTGYYVNPASDSNIASLYVTNYLDLTTGRAVPVRGYAGNFVSTQSASSNYPPFNFASTYADHSWGVVASFRINATGGGDRPSIQFSTGSSDTRWNVGYCYSDDQFRITQNMGINNSGGNDGWGNERFRIDTGGNVINNVATYSPIFYDSNNSGYYTDPASTSNINALAVNTINNLNPLVDVWHTSSEGKSRFYFSANSTTYYRTGLNFIWRNNSDAGIMTVDSNGYLKVNSGGDSLASYPLHVVGTGYASSDFRAPIFYDSNDTNYYLDPNSYSFIYHLSTNVGQEAPGAANSSSVGMVLRGNYNSNTWAHKFHKYDNGNGVPLYLSTTYAAGAWTAVQGWGYGLPYTSQVFGSLGVDGNLYAPIFYDTNDTGYYCDPHSTSQFHYVLANNWFRPQNDTGLYFQSYGYGIWAPHSSGGSYGNVSTYGTGRNGWNGYNLGGQWTLMNSGNGDNIGIHSNSTSWLWYWDGTLTNFYRGYTQFAGSARAPIFYDSDNTSYYCDPASTSRMGTINADTLYSYGNVTAYSDERLKTDWENLPTDFVEKLAKVKSGTYTRIDSGERQTGVGAQSLQAVLKEAVSEKEQYLGVNYGNAALVSAVELAKEVVDLRARVATLEALLSKLIED